MRHLALEDPPGDPLGQFRDAGQNNFGSRAGHFLAQIVQRATHPGNDHVVADPIDQTLELRAVNQIANRRDVTQNVGSHGIFDFRLLISDL